MDDELLDLLICGDDKKCREDLETAVQDLLSLDDPSRAQGRPGVEEKIPGLEEYSKRRLLYLSSKEKVFEHSFSSRCPVCGDTPTLLFKVNDTLYAKCTCGAIWRYASEWTCPACGSKGHENFTAKLYGVPPVLIFKKCSKCGFTFAVLPEPFTEVPPGIHKLHLKINVARTIIEATQDGRR